MSVQKSQVPPTKSLGSSDSSNTVPASTMRDAADKDEKPVVIAPVVEFQLDGFQPDRLTPELGRIVIQVLFEKALQVGVKDGTTQYEDDLFDYAFGD